MKKPLNISEAIKKAKELRKKGFKIILAGGCFDILHVGHLTFLENAKKHGDILFVMVESDEKIQILKGENRPFNTQEDRSKILAALEVVDYVISLPLLRSDKDYDNLLISLKPNIIATTKGDPNRCHKERQARLTGSEVVDVIDLISDKSTTKLAKFIFKKASL